MRRVAIIGGGITGLSAAYTFQKMIGKRKDIDYVLLEASNRVGGVIVTDKADGFLIEGGPDCFISTKPQTIELGNELGIGDHLLNSSEENKGTFVFSGGKLHELPEGIMTMVPTKLEPFLKTKLISWPGKLRVAMDLVIPAKRSGKEESLTEFVQRRLGKEILDKIAEPLVGGIHASDPDKMSLKSTFPRFIEMEQEYGSLIKGSLASMNKVKQAQAGAASQLSKRPHRTFFVSFAGGMQELIDALEHALGSDKLSTGKRVQRISKHGQTNGYEIILDGQKPVFADAVVVALPAFAAATVLEVIDKPLSQGLKEIPYVDSATVSLAFKTENLNRPLQGYGVIVPLAEGRRLKAATWSSNKWALRAPEGFSLVRGFVGGAKNQEFVDLDNESLLKLVQEELAGIAGISGKPETTRIYRWKRGMAQYTMGHTERVQVIENKISSIPGLFLAGNAYHGVGTSDCIKSGNQAAEAAFNFLNS